MHFVLLINLLHGLAARWNYSVQCEPRDRRDVTQALVAGGAGLARESSSYLNSQVGELSRQYSESHFVSVALAAGVGQSLIRVISRARDSRTRDSRTRDSRTRESGNRRVGVIR